MHCARWVGLLLLGWARVGAAGECANTCWLDPGQLCVGSAGGRGFARLEEPGHPARLVVERHAGSCGTLEPIDPARVQAEISDQPGGPFTPLPTTHDERHLQWSPPHAGDFYVRLVEEKVAGDGRVFVRAIDGPPAERRVRVVPPPGTHGGQVEIRALPVDSAAALRAGFTDRSWPLVYAGSEVAQAPRPVKLAPGTYQVRWSGKGATALASFTLKDEPELRVELPRSSLRLAGKPPADGWLQLVVDSDANVAERLCLDRDWKSVNLRLYLPPGKVHVQWFRGPGGCPFRRSSQPPLFEETPTLSPRASVNAHWPPATSGAKQR